MNNPVDSAEQAFFAPPPAQACTRCGDFTELEDFCGRLLCAPCRAKLHEIQRTPMSTGSILVGVWQLIRAVGPSACALLFVFDLPLAAASFFVDLPAFVFGLYSVLVGILAQGAVLHMAHQVIVRAGAVSVGDAFRATWRRYGALIYAKFVAGLVTAAMTLLLIVPGILRALSYVLVLPIALHEEGTGASELASSRARMKGRRTSAFGAYLIGGLPLVFGFVVLFIALVVISAVNPEPASEEAAQRMFAGLWQLVVPALLLPWTLIPAVCYAKVHASSSLETDLANG